MTQSSSGFPKSIRNIAVIGPGIVGMPMAALLADAGRRQNPPVRVLVVQRASATSGWKVDAINSGRSPIGGVEPALDRVVAEAVAAGSLAATHDVGRVAQADAILVCVQTDKRGIEPDYDPLFEALEGVARALRTRPPGRPPVVIFESTLAPSSMATVVRQFFADRGLEEGRDLRLGNSPNRVMPGRLVDRVAAADKLVGGLRADTAELIRQLYSQIVTRGTLHATNSLTAEIVKTLENAYRDVRIAYAHEVVRWCDRHDYDFYQLRDAVNAALEQVDAASDDAGAVPSGGLLVPTIGVGGHCLPKDGVLLWWRRLEQGADPTRSIILESRRINDAAPAEACAAMERAWGSVAGRHVALLGVAYRFDSEDTRNSPTLALARLLRERGATVRLHDPFVQPGDQNLMRTGLNDLFTNDLGAALSDADVAVLCTAHRVYLDGRTDILRAAPRLRAMFDGANAWRREDFEGLDLEYAGIGRGHQAPPRELVAAVLSGFCAVERGVANEVAALIEFFNDQYADDDFNRVDFEVVQRLAGTCVTGCRIADPGPVAATLPFDRFEPHLAMVALQSDESASAPA